VVSTPQVKGRAKKEVIKVSSIIGSNPSSAPSLLYIIIGTPIPN
jgi:predicted regulator of amino acid metabolism with ACT domain